MCPKLRLVSFGLIVIFSKCVLFDYDTYFQSLFYKTM